MQKETLPIYLVNRTVAFTKLCMSKIGELITNFTDRLRPTRTSVLVTSLALIVSAGLIFESLNSEIVKAQGSEQNTGVVVPEAVAPETVSIKATDATTYTFIKKDSSSPEIVVFNPDYPYPGQLNGEQFLGILNGSTFITTTTKQVNFLMNKGDQIVANQIAFSQVANIGKDEKLVFQGEVGSFEESLRVVRLNGQGDVQVTIHFRDSFGDIKTAKQKLTAEMSDIHISKSTVFGLEITNGGAFFGGNGKIVKEVGQPYTLYLPLAAR